MIKKIIGAKETVKMSAVGTLVTYATYQYMLDELGPFTFEIEKSRDSASALNEAMKVKEDILKASGVK